MNSQQLVKFTLQLPYNEPVALSFNFNFCLEQKSHCIFHFGSCSGFSHAHFVPLSYHSPALSSIVIESILTYRIKKLSFVHFFQIFKFFLIAGCSGYIHVCRPTIVVTHDLKRGGGGGFWLFVLFNF